MDQHVPSLGTRSADDSSDPARAADLRSLWLAILIIGGSIVVEAAGRITDIRLHRTPIDPAEIWLLETISHVAILLLVPAVLLVLDRTPVTGSTWRRWLPIHILGALGFAALHIAIMWGARELAFPSILDRPYEGDLFEPARLFAEMRKDILIYLILVTGLAGSRAIERHRAEAKAVVTRARRTGAVTLKSGGHTYIVNAADIISAQAAENYVEVHTAAKTYLARMTLTQLERLLAETGSRHVRVHRSYVVNLAHVASVAPTGEGDVLITLSNGAVLPGSRRFRDRLGA
jgi:hypothetical protein